MAGLTAPRPQFNVGSLFLIPSGTSPDTRRIGYLQDVKISDDVEIALSGATENRFITDAAIKSQNLSGEIAFARVWPTLYLAAMPGTAKTAGSEALVSEEAASIPATPGPYTVTVTGSAAFGTDLGVRDVLGGYDLECVTGTPTTGQYAVAAGVYTFAAADQARAVKITYSTTAATGETITISQTLAEADAVFYALKWFSKTGGKTVTRTINKALIYGLSAGLKLQDWGQFNLKFQALPDDSGVVGTIKFEA
jgi:hypothetical protein